MSHATQAILTDLSVAVALLAGLVLVMELGFRRGRRGKREGEAKTSGQVGAVQGAILGLLGLLLGFSFAGAAARILEKQDLIVQEANDIGTAYLRADLLTEPHRGELRAALKDYTERRIELSSRLRGGIAALDLAEVDRQHARIWHAAVNGVSGTPELALAVLNPVNDVLDIHSTRLAAGQKHLPSLVVGLLIGCSILATAAIGYGCGLSDRRFLPMTLPLVILISTMLWTIIDLDHPRAGLIQLSDEPLKALKFDAAP